MRVARSRQATGSPTRRRRRWPAGRGAGGPRRGERGHRSRQLAPEPCRADQALCDPARRLAAWGRRADADDEAPAQADPREVRRRDRVPVLALDQAPPAPAQRPCLIAGGDPPLIEVMYQVLSDLCSPSVAPDDRDTVARSP